MRNHKFKAILCGFKEHGLLLYSLCLRASPGPWTWQANSGLQNQAGLELEILPPIPLRYWDYRCPDPGILGASLARQCVASVSQPTLWCYNKEESLFKYIKMECVCSKFAGCTGQDVSTEHDKSSPAAQRSKLAKQNTASLRRAAVPHTWRPLVASHSLCP